MKPLDPRPSAIDPESVLQEHGSWTAAAVMIFFLALFWVQARWEILTAKHTNDTKSKPSPESTATH